MADAARHPHWGRRKRRLRWTIQVLTATAAVALGAGLWWSLGRGSEVYRPGEENPDITRRLARGLPADAPEPRLEDVTAAAGLGDFQHFTGARTSQLPEDMGSGVAWGDFDRDADDDLFVVAGGGALTLRDEELAPSLLYENLGDGTFRVVESFPDTRIRGMAAAWGDADGDGWPDLALSGYRSLRLYRNRDGILTRDPSFPEPDGFWADVVWADFDNDRDFDLYVCGYVRYQESDASGHQLSQQYGAAVAYTLNPSSYPPERNLLFRNDGGTFSEVAEELGVANPEGRSLGALWHDFDDDGWLDLYIGNDISDNVLYLNLGGRFVDSSLASWVADYRGAMGLAAGDWNRDGDDDLFVSHWIGQENALYDSLLADLAARAPAEQAPAGRDEPPKLQFQDRSAPLGLGQIALRHVGWGSELVDLDGDGWLDLVVVNGSTFETSEAPRRLKPQESLFLWSQRGEFFHDLAPLNPTLSAPHVARGLAWSDYDLDGDADLLVVHHGEGVQLLRNDMQTGHWLELRLRKRLAAGGDPPGEAWGEAYGTKAIVTAGGADLRRAVTGSSYLSQSSATLHFGLGAATRADRVEVRWLAGERQVFGPLEADALYELREGEPDPIRRAATNGGDADDRARVLAFWEKHRAAMQAMKRDDDLPRAIGLFREALELDPEHEDALYYLASCLAAEGETDEALELLAKLQRLAPRSRRAFSRWGTLRALTSRRPEDLAAAASALERALEINPEETGSLLALGEVAILRHELDTAVRRLEWACRTNPRAVGGLFLRGYVAWKRGDDDAARTLLAAAAEARGPEWKPEGSVAEGDVRRRMHAEDTPLSAWWRSWDGGLDPDRAFAPLDEDLSRPAAG